MALENIALDLFSADPGMVLNVNSNLGIPPVNGLLSGMIMGFLKK